MRFVPAHLYKGSASVWTMLKHAYLYKPEHQSCKNVGASPAVAFGYTCAWLPLVLSQTRFKHICTSFGIGDPVTATRPLIADPFPGALYKPGHQSSKNVCAPAAVARGSPAKISHESGSPQLQTPIALHIPLIWSCMMSAMPTWGAILA